MTFDCLQNIPDPHGMGFDALTAWLNERLAAIQATRLNPELISSFTPYEFEQDIDHACGAESSAEWRKFFVGILLADWACYDAPQDRIDYARLKYILSSSYKYMRLWCVQMPDGQMTPVGYTGGYPISKMVYEGAQKNLDSIDDRGFFMPHRFVKIEDVKYLYGLNISIIPQLRNTICSRRMIRAYQKDVVRHKGAKLMAITVDKAGRKFANLSDLNHIADVDVQGHNEGLFA